MILINNTNNQSIHTTGRPERLNSIGMKSLHGNWEYLRNEYLIPKTHDPHNRMFKLFYNASY